MTIKTKTKTNEIKNRRMNTNTTKLMSILLLSAFVMNFEQQQHLVAPEPKTINSLTKKLFYVGQATDLSYNKTYWSLAILKFYNSSYKLSTETFIETTYLILKDKWPSSYKKSLNFHINAVNHQN